YSRFEFLRIVFISHALNYIESPPRNALEKDAAHAAFEGGEGRLKNLAIAGRDGIDDTERIGKIETSIKGSHEQALRLLIRRARWIARKHVGQAAAPRSDNQQIVLSGQPGDIDCIERADGDLPSARCKIL